MIYITTFFSLLLFIPGVAASRDPLEVIFTNISKNCSEDEGAKLEVVFPYIESITDFLHAKGIRSVVEVGCGDWQFSKYIDWDGIDYIGYDIVKEIVEKNYEEYSAPNITFGRANCILADLPRADLLICKDVLQHLSNESIREFLKQLPKYSVCLITNDIDFFFNTNNSPIQDGEYRPVDLTKPPFNIRGHSLFDYRSGATQKQILVVKTKRRL